jgi:hypothetical protein
LNKKHDENKTSNGYRYPNEYVCMLAFIAESNASTESEVRISPEVYSCVPAISHLHFKKYNFLLPVGTLKIEALEEY